MNPNEEKSIAPRTVSGTYDLLTRITPDELLDLEPGDIIMGAYQRVVGKVLQTTARRSPKTNAESGFAGEIMIGWDSTSGVRYLDVSYYAHLDSYLYLFPADDEAAQRIGRKPQYETKVYELSTDGNCYETIHRMLANGTNDPRWPKPGTNRQCKLTLEFP